MGNEQSSTKLYSSSALALIATLYAAKLLWDQRKADNEDPSHRLGHINSSTSSADTTSTRALQSIVDRFRPSAVTQREPNDVTLSMARHILELESTIKQQSRTMALISETKEELREVVLVVGNESHHGIGSNSGASSYDWASPMAALLYYELVTLGSVRSVPLIAILAHMEDFPVDRDPIFNATTSLELDPRAITFATLITMHMLQSISDLPTTLPTRIVPSRDVSAVLSDRPSFLKSKLASLGEGEPLQFTGYYTYGVTASDNPRIHDPPTRFVLRYDPATGTLRGNGQDVEDFTIDGNVDANGLVTLNKAYQSWSWKWIGVFLRWGMAGLWGSESRGGMFYVWQQDQNSTNTTAK